jgi:TolB protein
MSALGWFLPAGRIRLSLCALSLACGGHEVPGPSEDPGQLLIRVFSHGLETPVQGYLLAVDGGPTIRIPGNGELVLDLPPGRHQIRLLEVPAACTPLEGSWMRFIGSGLQSLLEVRVECLAPGTVLVSTATAGVDPDRDGYHIVINGTAHPIGLQSEVEFANVRPGAARVELRSVAGNCTVGGGARRAVPVEEREIASVSFEIACRARPQFGPGDYIVVSRRAHPQEDSDLYLLNDQGGQLAKLTDHPADEFGPTFSPDGNRIGYLRADRFGQSTPVTRVLELTSGQESQVPQSTWFPVSWSPDGSRMALNVAGELILVNADGGGAVTVTSGAVGRAWWSPDGTRLAFTRGALEAGNVYLIDLHGSNIRQVTLLGNRQAGPWSIGGEALLIQVSIPGGCVFKGWPSPCGPVPLDLALLDPDTRSEQLLTTPYDELHPEWSPDGQRVLFIAYDGGQPDLFALSLDSKQVVNLTRSFSFEESFSIVRRR